MTDPDRETGRECEACDGAGMIVREEGTTIRGATCGVCKGLGWLTISELRLWHIAKEAQRKRERP